ncbi:serine hydrolase domain-containing protein [Emticicia fontis]
MNNYLSRSLALSIIIILSIAKLQAQSIRVFADSIRKAYQIPELAYAVVSSDSIFESHTLGVQRANSNFPAKPTDRFHIGSNTKAITAFIAALLVQQKKISWDTKFLTLFPELKKNSKKVYANVTLQDLITFRGLLPSYTYTFEQPTKEHITGDNQQQRFLLAKYFLSQKPMPIQENGLTPSNTDYIVAGLMLEKASGKSFKTLVQDLGNVLSIDFGFDYPNLTDPLQTWGHDASLQPLPPSDNYKLNWLLSAGNINVSMNDYLKFAQLQLKGLKGQTDVLPQQVFHQLLYGAPVFAFGWFNEVDQATGHTIAYNEGNAGAFITQVHIIKEADRAYMVFTNAASSTTAEGIQILMKQLKKQYGE